MDRRHGENGTAGINPSVVSPVPRRAPMIRSPQKKSKMREDSDVMKENKIKDPQRSRPIKICGCVCPHMKRKRALLLRLSFTLGLMCAWRQCGPRWNSDSIPGRPSNRLLIIPTYQRIAYEGGSAPEVLLKDPNGIFRWGRRRLRPSRRTFGDFARPS